MEFTIYCPSCGQKYEVGLDFVGQEVSCEKCGRSFVVMPPGQNATPAPAVVPEFKPVRNTTSQIQTPPPPKKISFALLAFRVANCIFLAGALFFLILTIANGINNFAQIFYAVFILLLAAPGFALAEGLKKIDEIHYRQSLEKKEK